MGASVSGFGIVLHAAIPCPSTCQLIIAAPKRIQSPGCSLSLVFETVWEHRGQFHGQAKKSVQNTQFRNSPHHVSQFSAMTFSPLVLLSGSEPVSPDLKFSTQIHQIWWDLSHFFDILQIAIASLSGRVERADGTRDHVSCYCFDSKTIFTGWSTSLSQNELHISRLKNHRNEIFRNLKT